jgi:hypothetical protein
MFGAQFSLELKRGRLIAYLFTDWGMYVGMALSEKCCQLCYAHAQIKQLSVSSAYRQISKHQEVTLFLYSQTKGKLNRAYTVFLFA